jgi:DNA-directed RNA polymerase specialized sigma subunit
MRISEQVLATGTGGDVGTARADRLREDDVDVDWSERTQRVLTRDLLVRASRAGHGEGQALRFRALHLNLPLVAEVADRLGLTGTERARIEHAALDGLHEAVRLFDPYDDGDFATFASPCVERQIRTYLRSSVLAPAPITYG